MSFSIDNVPRASYVDGHVNVAFAGGVSLTFPIVGNWRLEGGTAEQLNNMEIDEEGIHWPDLDEDLSYEGILSGDYGQYIRRRSA